VTKGKERQIRSLQSNLSTRAEPQDGEKIIEGYFAVFNSETELWRGAFEEIAPGAFTETLSNDIRALINHDTSLVLARSKPGTLKLTVDTRGLWGEIRINEKDTDALNLYERLKRGDVDQCSFGFNVLEEETDYREDGTVKWTLKKIDLHEISVVTFPAYSDTGVSARKADFEKDITRLRDQKKNELKERLQNGFKTIDAK
jgi:HK97 family phage prohead protease